MKRLFVLLLVIASSFTFVDEVKLEYTFKKGDQYQWEQASTQAITQTIPAMGEMTINSTMNAIMFLKVIEVSGQSARFEAHYTKLKVLSKSFFGSINMDTESSEETNQNKVAKAAMGKKFFFIMNSMGRIEKVEGVENLYADFDKLNLDERTLNSVRQTIQQIINPSTVKGSLEIALLQYPERKVKAGDTWKHTSGVPMNFPIMVEQQWSLKSIDTNAATLASTGNLKTTDKEKVNTLPNGMKSKVNLNGTQQINGSLARKSGWPDQVSVVTDLKGTMTLLAGGFIMQDMDVPMQVSSEATYTIAKK